MGSVPSVARGNDASSSRIRDFDTAAGIRVNARGAFVHDLGCPRGRNKQLHSIEAGQRQFTLLAKLVAAVAPAKAAETAARLLETFGTLSGVLSAPAGSLNAVAQDEKLVRIITAARSAFVEGSGQNLKGRVFDLADRQFVDRFVGWLEGAEDEQLHAVYFDPRRRYLEDEFVASGSSSQIAVRIRPILRRAIELDASWIVLIHNHPSGNPRPSALDCEFTNQVRRLAQPLGIGLLDHLIVSGTSVFSMRTAELVQ